MSDKQPGDCGYVGFYAGKRYELYAQSSYTAQRKLVQLVKAPKSKQHLAYVVLAELPDGTPVTQTAV